MAVLTVIALAPRTARAAEWQVKPFLGITFGSGTTFTLAGDGHTAPTFGASILLLGDVLGVEADVGRTPGFFGPGSLGLILGSSVTTVTGNLVVAMPREMARYSLRPYIAGGGGLMRVRIDDTYALLPVTSNLGAFDAGGGVTGFLTDNFGVSWDVRYFRSIRGKEGVRGVSIGAEQLSFWRANMALALRF
jgi:hypothetical protein